jgi:hypothetical protein
MTTPQQIDGGKSPPCPYHPAVRSETMTERKRCLALIDKELRKREEHLKSDEDSDLVAVVEQEIESRIRHIRALIQYGVKP